MEKEILSLVVSNLSTNMIKEIYQNKKINHSGFRASSEKEIIKNRNNLNQNLLKINNLSIVHNLLITRFKSSLANKFQTILEVELWDDIIIFAYGTEDYKYLHEYILNNKEQQNKDNKNIHKLKDHDLNILKENKIISKLEKKIEKLNAEISNRDKIQKKKLEELSKKLDQEKLLNNTLFEQKNVLQKDLDKALVLVQKIKEENLSLVISLEESIKENEDLIEVIDNLETERIKEKNTVNKQELTNIALIGHREYEFQYDEISSINFKLYKINDIHNLLSNNELYKEIWVINFDLNLKEKKILQKAFATSKNVFNVRNIETLIDLNRMIEQNNFSKARED